MWWRLRREFSELKKCLGLGMEADQPQDKSLPNISA